MSLTDNYLADADYHKLVADLLVARDPDQVRELLGEVGGIWPASIREDQPLTVTIRHATAGRITGTFEVQGGMVHVTYQGVTKATQIGGMTPEAVAQMLLLELAA